MFDTLFYHRIVLETKKSSQTENEKELCNLRNRFSQYNGHSTNKYSGDKKCFIGNCGYFHFRLG